MQRNPAKPMLYFKVLQLVAARPQTGMNRYKISPVSKVQVAMVPGNVKGRQRPMR